jgi:mortality factor 4-like protein 1
VRERERARARESFDTHAQTRTHTQLTLPATLQRRLLDDLDMIEERKLLPLPRTPCIRQVLDMFVASRGKRSKQEQDEVVEMVQGLTAFFDMALPRMLLFSFESLKYKRVQSEHPDLKPSQLYGGEHLLRLLMKMPTEMMTAKVTADKAMSLQPRLQELIKFLEKNEGTIMTNEWEPADTEYIEAFEEQLTGA